MACASPPTCGQNESGAPVPCIFKCKTPNENKSDELNDYPKETLMFSQDQLSGHGHTFKPLFPVEFALTYCNISKLS